LPIFYQLDLAATSWRRRDGEDKKREGMKERKDTEGRRISPQNGGLDVPLK